MNRTNILGFLGTLVLTNVSAAQTIPMLGSTPPTNTGYYPYPTSLYRMNDVSKSLGLTPQQLANLNTLTADVQTKYRNGYTNLNTLPEAKRATQLQELNQQYANEWNKGARDIFNQTQWNRYQQLRHQHEGINSLYYPDIQQQLNLSEQQARDLDVERAWNTRELDAIKRVNATNPAKATAMFREYWKERDRRINAFLTPAQQKKWAEITGEPFTFSGPGPYNP